MTKVDSRNVMEQLRKLMESGEDRVRNRNVDCDDTQDAMDRLRELLGLGVEVDDDSSSIPIVRTAKDDEFLEQLDPSDWREGGFNDGSIFDDEDVADSLS